MERVTQEIEISDFDNLDDTVNDRDGTEEEDIDEADESIDEDLLQEGVDDTVEKYISAEVYKCTKCDSQYSLEAVLKVHMEQKHKNEKMFSCKYCDWHSDYKYNLERHIKKQHGSNNETQNHEATTNNQNQNQTDLFPCDDCDYAAKKSTTWINT